MSPPTPLQIFLALILLPTLFYLAGPFSASQSPPAYHSATADARLARFLDAVTPKTGQVYAGHGLEISGNSGGHGGAGSGRESGGGAKKIVLWPLGEGSKVMGRPGVRGGSWRSSSESVGSVHEDEEEDATKVGMEGGMLEVADQAENDDEDEDDTSQHPAVTGEAEVTGHT